MTGAEPYQLSDEIEEMISAATRDEIAYEIAKLEMRRCAARMILFGGD